MAHLSGKRIAIIATDHVEESELLEPLESLRGSGAEVAVYSAHDRPIQAAKGDVNATRKVEVDGTFDQLDVDGIDALIVPGGTVNADTIRMDEKARTVVRQVAAAGKPLAVICHGPWLLVSAGLVEGRRLTSWPSVADDIRNAGGDWVDEEVVVDGNLITSRKPADIPAFVSEVEKALA